MGYIYHQEPRIMIGNLLMALNEYRELMPNTYQAAFAKYEPNRLELPKKRLPILDCLWNDVLHTSAVPIDVIQEEHAKLGAPFHTKYFRIDTRDLDQSKLLIYTYTEPPEEGFTFSEGSFQPFSEELLERCSKFPERAREAWRRCLAEGRPLFRYHLIPHVLYRGTIDIRKCALLETSNPAQIEK